MKSTLKSFNLYLVLIVTTFILSVPAFAKETLQVVDNKKVCMVTNMVFPRDQIPVQHSGKTYYGCCENCKKTLSENASSRTAIDPITKKKIDKATAIIAARSDGSVIYFETLKSMNEYQKQSLN